MEPYEILKDIGEGSFGVVQMAQNKETGEFVAIKRMKKKYTTWDECLALREVKALGKLRHPNIVRLREVFKLERDLHLVFEFCERNLLDLYTEDYITKGLLMPEAEIRRIIREAAAGLAQIHSSGFFHRDLKPENLLVGTDGLVKIADFGLAREIRSSPVFTDYVATRWYRAPEILLKSTSYNSPVDIFALGCIMAELYIGGPLFKGISEIDQINKICSILGTPPRTWTEGYCLASKAGLSLPQYSPLSLEFIIKGACPQALDLMKSMLNFDSSKRPSASKILSHPFILWHSPLENIFASRTHKSFSMQTKKLTGTSNVFGEDTLDIYSSTRKLPKAKHSKENEDPEVSAKKQKFEDDLLELSSSIRPKENSPAAYSNLDSSIERKASQGPRGSMGGERELLKRDRISHSYQKTESKRPAFDPLFDDQLEELLNDPKFFSNSKPKLSIGETFSRRQSIKPKDEFDELDFSFSSSFKGPSYLTGIQQSRFGQFNF